MKILATILTIIGALAGVIGLLAIFGGIHGDMAELVTGGSLIGSAIFVVLLSQIGWHCADMSESLRKIVGAQVKPESVDFTKPLEAHRKAGPFDPVV